MSNPSPILDVSGRVHAVVSRTVEDLPARSEERDDSGNLLKTALPAREGYTVEDVTILTADGGFATVSLLPAALDALGGELPTTGDTVTYPVRPFVKWNRGPRGSYSTVGLSVAGDVAAARKSSGRRAAVQAVSNG